LLTFGDTSIWSPPWVSVTPITPLLPSYPSGFSMRITWCPAILGMNLDWRSRLCWISAMAAWACAGGGIIPGSTIDTSP
jgi:hypothetical protein